MTPDIAATADSLITQADTYTGEYEKLAADPDASREAGYWRHEADAWRQYADRLRAIAAGHSLTVEE